MYIKEWEMPNKNTPQFKVGDIVKILPRNGSPLNYYPTYVDGMQKYAEQVGVITKVTPQSCLINLDDGGYHWPLNALQLIILKIDPHNLKNGDYIKLTNAYTDTSIIYLFKELKDNGIYRHASYSLNNKNLNIVPDRYWFISSTTEIIYATVEEKKLLDNALLEQGYKWNSLTKQLESIGVVDVSLVNTCLNDFSVQPVDVSSFRNSIQRINTVTNLPSSTKGETQTETELNLFPKKKHYQLNFNY